MNKDIETYNDKGQPHGYWEIYRYDGALMYKCYWLNGKGHGYWESTTENKKNITYLTYNL